jgi:methylated-DNA-[protein]-cysteine S-methyltransferase
MTSDSPSCTALVVHRSPLGWFGVGGDEEQVTLVTIGHASRLEVLRRAGALARRRAEPSSLVRDAADEILRYLSGEPAALSSIPVAAPPASTFAGRVVRALRRVAYGEVVSYGELARRAGAPGAARAVGGVMARNPVPLLVPCHRVIASGGGLGGFSAPTGVDLKQALLQMEAGGPQVRERAPARSRTVALA